VSCYGRIAPEVPVYVVEPRVVDWWDFSFSDRSVFVLDAASDYELDIAKFLKR